MNRQDYTEARQAFIEAEEAPVLTPVKAGGAIIGWTMERGGKALPSARSGARVFKTIEAAATVCRDFGIAEVLVSVGGAS